MKTSHERLIYVNKYQNISFVTIMKILFFVWRAAGRANFLRFRVQ